MGSSQSSSTADVTSQPSEIFSKYYQQPITLLMYRFGRITDLGPARPNKGKWTPLQQKEDVFADAPVPDELLLMIIRNLNEKLLLNIVLVN